MKHKTAGRKTDSDELVTERPPVTRVAREAGNREPVLIVDEAATRGTGRTDLSRRFATKFVTEVRK